MVIACDHIFNEDAGGFTAGEIAVLGNRFGGNGDGETADYRAFYALPGFIDIHTHGVMGRAWMDPAGGIDERARYIASTGVTAFCPTTVLCSDDEYRRGMETARASQTFSRLRGVEEPEDFAGAAAIGVYLEGPFLSPEKPGAADRSFFRKPDIGLFEKLNEYAGGTVRFVAIAPELEGAGEFIRRLSGSVVCTLAHSSADYETGLRAIKDGASQLTHLFNAMPPFLHRAPGLIGAAFDSENVRAELIADGEHVHPSAVRAAFRLFGDDRVLLISDSLFSGLPDGTCAGGGLKVFIKDGIARIENGALAGATKTLGQCVVNAVKNIGIPLFSAVKCAAVNPAKQAGVFHERGSIEPGKIADLVLMDRDFVIRKVMVRGKFIPGVC
jgi:N-acetylglucosamine-6-phosphate deacetylase